MKKTLVICLLILSCTGVGDGFKKVLTEEKGCWVFYNYPDEQIDNSNVKISGCNCYFANGTFKDYSVNENAIKEISRIDQVERNGIWSYLQADSSFVVGGKIFKVIRFNQDTIIVENSVGYIQRFIRIYVR